MPYAIHVAGPAKILDATAVVLDQVEGHGVNLAQAVVKRGSAGEVYSRFSGLMSLAPRFSLTTERVAAALTKIGAEGLVLATGFEVYNQAVDLTTGKRAGASAHEKYAIATGIVLPRRLSCRQNDVARLTFDVVGINAGGVTNPVVRTGSVSLPTLTGTWEQFTLGPVKINGVSYDGLQSLDVDFGLGEDMQIGNGATYPQAAYLGGIHPRISLSFNDAAIAAAIGETGLAEAATSVIYLRKLSNAGVRVADGTAQHVSLAPKQGLWIMGGKSVSHPRPAETQVEIEPTYNGTLAPIVWSFATAIS